MTSLGWGRGGGRHPPGGVRSRALIPTDWCLNPLRFLIRESDGSVRTLALGSCCSEVTAHCNQSVLHKAPPAFWGACLCLAVLLVLQPRLRANDPKGTHLPGVGTSILHTRLFPGGARPSGLHGPWPSPRALSPGFLAYGDGRAVSELKAML